jgi:glycosyltransferase involved in cell wall biosynthesis
MSPEISGSSVWLSICIPTYNRPIQFERMLQSILPQIMPGTELVIRDDSENINTKAVVHRLLENKNIKFRYFSGPRMGVDSAAIFLLEKAEGRYIWWFSDDDTICPGVLQDLWAIISKEIYSTIWANFTYGQEGALAVDRDSGAFTSPDEVLNVLGTNVGLISTQIIEREIASQAINFARNHIHGFSFASTAIFLKAASAGGKNYFYRGPALKCNPTEIDEIKRITIKDGFIKNEGFKVYGEYFRALIVDLPKPFTKKAKAYMLSRNFSSLWRGILVGWVGGWDTPKGKRVSMLRLYWKYPECWIALLLFSVPLPILRTLYPCYKTFYSHRKFIFFEKFNSFFK